jgi:hypothetical protein
MRSLSVTFAVVAALVAATGCDRDQTQSQPTDEKVFIVGVRAPLYEPSFEQRYKVKLDLPMEEDAFLTLIEELELSYYAEGPKELGLKNSEEGYWMPTPPKHTYNYDMSRISHSYFIYEQPDRRGRRQVNYLALVTPDKQVVFVENYFSYSAW